MSGRPSEPVETRYHRLCQWRLARVTSGSVAGRSAVARTRQARRCRRGRGRPPGRGSRSPRQGRATAVLREPAQWGGSYFGIERSPRRPGGAGAVGPPPRPPSPGAGCRRVYAGPAEVGTGHRAARTAVGDGYAVVHGRVEATRLERHRVASATLAPKREQHSSAKVRPIELIGGPQTLTNNAAQQWIEIAVQVVADRAVFLQESAQAVPRPWAGEVELEPDAGPET